MTKQEIIDAIEKGIAGQGTMVDLGGVLPKVLKAIVDALPTSLAPKPAITYAPYNDQPFSLVSVSEAARLLGITEDEVLSIPEQLIIKRAAGFGTNETEFTRIRRTKDSENTIAVLFGDSNGSNVEFIFTEDGSGSWLVSLTEY